MAYSTNQSLGGGVGNLVGSVYDYSTSYGGKPNVPSTTTTAADSIAGNISNLGSLYNLADSQNTFSANQAVKTQNELTPGYSGNMEKWSADIADLLSGKVSSGTITTLEQTAAERGIGSGIGGSQANESSLLRALGLTAEGQQQTGAAQLSAQIAASPKVSAFDMTPYLTSAADAQSAQYAANTIASAAVPASAASAAMGAAKSGVSTGINAAGTSPAATKTTNSIGDLLNSILGTGSGVGGVPGTSGGVAGDNASLSFDDWYKQVYGESGANSSTQDYSGDQSFGAGTYGGQYDNTNTFDASVYA